MESKVFLTHRNFKEQPLTVAIVGATGAVGREMLSILEAGSLPVGRILAFASPNSLGEELTFRNQPVIVGVVEPGCFKGVDVVLGATSATLARAWVPGALESGALVIDNSSAFRMNDDVPLVVPEVNEPEIRRGLERGLIANPNCSTIQLVTVLKPLHEAARLKRVVVSTYQSTSGTGQKGMEALSREVLTILKHSHVAHTEEEYEEASKELAASPYPHQIAFNAIPQIGDFMEDYYTGEEHKMRNESKKILGIPDLRITTTCVRVPWFACHAETVNIELEAPLPRDRAKELLERAPGVRVDDDPSSSAYPMPFMLAGSDDVFVGRIRQDDSVPHGLNLWIVADNLRKGAALNAVQILEVALTLRESAAG